MQCPYCGFLAPDEAAAPTRFCESCGMDQHVGTRPPRAGVGGGADAGGVARAALASTTERALAAERDADRRIAVSCRDCGTRGVMGETCPGCGSRLPPPPQ
ncbi:MAG TPA: hypothetical protein VG389_03520 [Myxococcota bacterium]|nr:hypothetical protein [Myxococcota bacterium]